MTDPSLPPHLVIDGDRLSALDDFGLREAAPDATFDGFVLLARTLCAAPAALVSLVDEDRQWFMARSGFGPTQTPLSQSVCSHALNSTGLLIIPDLRADPRTNGNTLVTGEPGLQFYAGAPLRTSDGHTLGTLCVLDTMARPDGLTAEQAENLNVLAKSIMVQLDLQRRLRASQAEVERLREALQIA